MHKEKAEMVKAALREVKCNLCVFKMHKCVG